MLPRKQYLFLLLSLSSIFYFSNALECRELTAGNASPSERLLLSNFSHVFKCKAVSGLLVYPHVWRPISLHVDCGKLQRAKIYTGPSPDALIQRYDDKEEAWCTVSSLLTPGCELQLSPFLTTYVGVRKFLNTGSSCSFTYDNMLSSWMLGSCVAGAIVLLLAAPLSESMALRVTSGGLVFALGSGLILMFILARLVPGRRSMAVVTALLGSSSWALFHTLTGHWIPSFYSLFHSRWLLGYLTISGLLGAALTYLYGGVENPRLNRVLCVGLRLLGLLLLYTGTWTQPAVFVAIVALALVLKALPLLRAVVSLSRRFSAPRAAPVHQVPPPPAAVSHQPPVTPVGSNAGTPLMAIKPQRLFTDFAVSPQLSAPHMTPINSQQLTPEGGMGGHNRIGDYAVHPYTGKSIRVGDDEWNELIENGWSLCSTSGRLLPPPGTPGAASGSEGTISAGGSTARRRRHHSRWAS